MLRVSLLGAAVLATRLPFLGPGYGSDPDAWRLADAARFIHDTGHYGASRLPGHPVQEVVSSWLWPGRELALNGATALLSALAVLSFYLIVRRLRLPHPEWTALALAMTPVVYVHSASTMDYVWALAFLLCSLHFAGTGRAMLSGVSLGLAVGCRISSLLFVVPIAVLLPSTIPDAARLGMLARFAGSAALVGALAYVPVLLEYGTGFLRSYQLAYPNPVIVLKLATLDLWGVVGLAGLGVALVVLAARAIAGRPGSPRPQPERGRWTAGSLLAIGLTLASFFPLPHEAGYLLPAVPFALLLLGLWLPPRVHLLLCVSLLLSPFVLELTERAKPYAPPATRWALHLTLAGRESRLEPFQGPIFFDHARRRSELRYVDSVLRASSAGPGERIVIVHDWLPVIRVLEGGDRVNETRYVASMSLDSLRFHLGRGATVQYLPEADWPNELAYGFRLGEHGASELRAAP